MLLSNSCFSTTQISTMCFSTTQIHVNDSSTQAIPSHKNSPSPALNFLLRETRTGISKTPFRASRNGSQKGFRIVASLPSKNQSTKFDVEEFQKTFEQRFKLPHLRDIFDIKPIPSTFCFQSSCPVPDDEDDPKGNLRKVFVHNDDRVLLKVIKFGTRTSAGAECVDPNCNFVHQWVHRAGPRPEIYFEPSEVRAAIVTCGGLCPGLNDVIRQVVITLETYGVKDITGITYGYRGLTDDNIPELRLSRKVVQSIHLSGGSLLGVSRGGGNVSEIVDSIQKKGYNMIFVLGGNGTHAGGNAIHNECRRRKMKVVVVGVPKTIDNDILLLDKTFGFDTAVEEAQRAINAAYIEAHSAYKGIGIVKLMGRSSGFIAMHASLASGQIDVCLIPEVPFKIGGPDGLLQHLQNLLQLKGSAVICVAEGAGQDLFQKSTATDPSGNPVLGDIGVFLQKETKKHFQKIGMPADVKYIDPTYMIRACRANAADGILCTVLGQNAVHGAFAGFSGITVGICNTHYVYLPIPEVITYPRNVDPNSRMWHRCLTSTGQPEFH